MNRRIFIALILAFNTLLSINAQTILLQEGFEGEWLPAGWATYEYGQLGAWQHRLSDGANDSEKCAEHWNYTNGQTKDSWIVSPQISVTTSDYQLSFYAYGSVEGLCHLKISNGSGNPADGDFIDVWANPPAFWWEKYTIDLSTYIGEDLYIAWQYETTGGGRYWIDDILVAPSSFTDAGLAAIVAPTGYNPNQSTEDIVVKVKNHGTTMLTNLDINWSVNEATQTTFNGTGLNILEGEELDITIGQYNFTNGLYNITAEVIAPEDNNSNNNFLSGEYSVGLGYDLCINGLTPGQNYPNAGTRDVIVEIENKGETTLNDFDINWDVNSVNQATHNVTALDLQSGEKAFINIGTYDFSEGNNEIAIDIPIDYDLNTDNNSVSVNYAVGGLYLDFNTEWKEFQGDLHPLFWGSNFGMRGNWSAQNNDPNNYHGYLLAVNNSLGVTVDTLFTPLLNIQNGDEITFKICFPGFGGGGSRLIWQEASTGQVHVISSVSASSGEWVEFTYDISEAAGINRIGWLCIAGGGPGDYNIDDISSTASVYLFNNDLHIYETEFNKIPSIGIEDTVECRVFNSGANAVSGSDYSINLVQEGVGVLTSIPGVDLGSYEETFFEIPYTYTSEGQISVYAEIVYALDENINNNRSKIEDVAPVPANYNISVVGQKNSTIYYAPFNDNGDEFSGMDDLTQNLYYYNEIDGGFIYGVKYYYNNVAFWSNDDMPLQVWIAETQKDDMSTGWIPHNEFEEVFNGTVTLESTVYEEEYMYIPFDEPYPFNGDKNIVLQFYHDAQYPSTFGMDFYGEMTYPVQRTIAAVDRWTIDPQNPPAPNYPTNRYAYAEFVVVPNENSGIISGVVYDESNQPVNNATVSVESTPVEVTTNAAGEYSLPVLAFDEYTINATAYGYNINSQSITLNENSQTLDFYLDQRPQITITGNVIGSNNTSIPLENVEVLIEGYDTYTTTTNIDGDFELADVYGNSNYNLTLSLYGYHDYTEYFQIVDQNIDFGTIVMDEELISACAINAYEANPDAVVEWVEPASSAKSTIKLDTEEIISGMAYTNEPGENVWLGNKFPNSETITITDVELHWNDYVGGSEGPVTVDIFDADENLIASSEEFLTPYDQWLNVDVPNITIDNDFYIMVHWNSPAVSTHFLSSQNDWDNPQLNKAYVKFPNQPMILLTELLGTSNYKMFFIRTNVLTEGAKNSKEVLSYNLYRGLHDDIANATDWAMVNSEPIYSNEYTDNTWNQAVSGEDYRYAVEPVYTEGNGEMSFSNIISKVDGIIDLNDGDICIYPNPVSNTLHLNGISKDAVIEIYNVIGEKVFSTICNGSSLEIDMTNYNAGNYLLRVENNTGATTQLIQVVK